jgi:hypothetical protein
MGIRLRLRHDFGELLYVNKQQTSRGNWFRLVNMFNPEYSDLSPEDSYWISGEDDQGEIVVTQAGRVYYWPDTTLEQEARLMFYGGHDEGQRSIVTATDAKSISGVVFYGGSVWVRPDFRGRRLSQLLPRLGRAYAVARWPVDSGISFVAPALVEKGIAAGYGYKHASYSIAYPESPGISKSCSSVCRRPRPMPISPKCCSAYLRLLQFPVPAPLRQPISSRTR